MVPLDLKVDLELKNLSIEISKKDQQHVEKNVLLKVATFPLPQKWYISCGHGGLFHISYRFSMSCHVLFCNFCKF